MAGAGKNEKPGPSNGSGIPAVIELIGYVREDVRALREEMKGAFVAFSSRVGSLEEWQHIRVAQLEEIDKRRNFWRWTISRAIALGALLVSVVTLLSERLNWLG